MPVRVRQERRPSGPSGRASPRLQPAFVGRYNPTHRRAAGCLQGCRFAAGATAAPIPKRGATFRAQMRSESR